MGNAKDLTEDDIELLICCINFTKECLDRLPFSQFNKLFKGKINKTQCSQEFSKLLFKLSK